jgi:hypothetical protein
LEKTYINGWIIQPAKGEGKNLQQKINNSFWHFKFIDVFSFYTKNYGSTIYHRLDANIPP